MKSNTNQPNQQPQLSSRSPRVEFHGITSRVEAFGVTLPSNIDGVIDATSWVRRISWTTKTQAPYTTGSVELTIPFHHFLEVFPGGRRSFRNGRSIRLPEPGFWVVVRVGSRRTLGSPEYGNGWPAVLLSYVTSVDVQFNANEHGALETRIKLGLASFIEPIRKSRLIQIANKTSRFTIPGYTYAFDQWGKDVVTLLQSIVAGAPGLILNRLWYSLTPHMLPPSLVALGLPSLPAPFEELSTAKNIPLVWDRETCATWAPLRLPQQVRVQGGNPVALRSLNPTSSTWALLQETFAGQQELTEFFPTLSFPCLLSRPNFWTYTPVGEEEDTSIPTREGDPPLGVGSTAEMRTRPIVTAPQRNKMTAVGRALGSQPVVVYRNKPTLLAGITRFAFQSAYERAFRRQLELDDNEPLPAREQAVVNNLQTPFSEQVATATGRGTAYGQDPAYTEDYAFSGWQAFLRSEVHRFSFSVNDADRVNAVYTRPPNQQGTQVSAMGLYSEPVFRAPDVLAHGLRLKEIDWPFFMSAARRDKEGPSGVSISNTQSAMSEVHFSQLGCVDGQFSGRVRFESKARPELQVGNWLWGDVLDVAGSEVSFIGYCTQMTHTYTLNGDGVLVGRTSYDLERAILRPEPIIAPSQASRLRSDPDGAPKRESGPVVLPLSENLSETERASLERTAFSGRIDAEGNE